MFDIKIREKKRRRWLPLLIIGPMLGIGAYLIYSKRKAAQTPKYDPYWQTSTPQPAYDALHSDNGTSSTHPRPHTDSIDVSAKANGLLHKQVLDLNGDAVGEVEAVYYRSLSGDPEWIATSIGLADKKRVLVPLDGASVDEEIRLAQAKADIEAAPAIENETVDEETELLLYGHYGVRRVLPGVEGERDEGDLKLRMWQPAQSLETLQD